MATIHLTQYLRPSGKPAMIMAEIPDELAELADTLELSCEALPDMHVVIYAHRKGQSAEDELTEIADNDTGENSPDKALERLIRRFEEKHNTVFKEE